MQKDLVGEIGLVAHVTAGPVVRDSIRKDPTRVIERGRRDRAALVLESCARRGGGPLLLSTTRFPAKLYGFGSVPSIVQQEDSLFSRVLLSLSQKLMVPSDPAVENVPYG